MEGLEPGSEKLRPDETISGEPLTSSPLEEENGGLEAELEELEAGRPPSASMSFGTSRVISLRPGSRYTDSGSFDDEVSDNPLFGIPGRFRTSSHTSFTGANVLNASMSPAEGPSRSSTQDLSQSGSIHRHRNSSLPADDGMGALRQQILLIQEMDIPGDQKARMMHRLLTRGYSQAQEIYHAKHPARPHSPTGMISQERPTTPSSLSSFIWQINGTADNSTPNQQHTFHLSPDDLKRTYAPLEPLDTEEDALAATGDAAHPVRVKEEVRSLGCKHYKRNVKLQCSTCDRWYTCRLCHDEHEDHVLIRKDTKNMLCMLCGCAQRAGEFCVECGERTAWYYCGVCKLWDNDPNKNIYHCNDCGICRKGRGLGKDFFHCKTCGVCMSMSVEHSHKCIERVSDCDCPICGEYMFTSPRPVVFMLCGHSIHQACYYEHMKSSYKCPICSKSTVNMETQFRNLDRAIDSQPMPPQFQGTQAMVSCNDCYAKSAVKYHWLGLKCAICDSYNTAQISILSDPAVEVSVLESTEIDNIPVPYHDIGGNPSLLRPGVVPLRLRRHSSHIHSRSSGDLGRFSPYPIPQRVGRSVSPPRGVGFSDNALLVYGETDDSGDEDEDLDFWGRDEPRSVTSYENMDEEDMEDEDSDEDASIKDDCDDEADDDDQFELIGHR